MDASEIIQRLNLSDECKNIEAKRGEKIDRSILETVNSFSNEPGMGGGYLILGVEAEEQSLFPSYIVKGISNPDKLQLDLSTQCASIFNQPIRPQISIENLSGKNVLVAYIPELPESSKPVFFQSEGLPRGAYRRIGSSDQRCGDDDLYVFYNREDSLDSSIVQDTSLEDISDEAISLYRNLRQKVNPFAEELQYNDMDLLTSLGCLKKSSEVPVLTYAGLLVFGKRTSHRRLLPMVRVDYIRVPGNEWIEDPEDRFTTIDMRGSILEMVQRVFNIITDDLPKGFLLPEGELQAESIGLPSRALREALVNAFIHRSYRTNQPIQIIRYGNRIEIQNPGFSLKPEEHLGEPGSKNRNPFIAAIFHETNLAETKGSGIRSMRTLMQNAQLMPPTFESDHDRNQFTVRLLLHHFLGVEDVKWLKRFGAYDLNDDQKRSLIFIKEVGAIDNAVFRQLNGIDTLKASAELRAMRDKGILDMKGKSKTTYYVPGKVFADLISTEQGISVDNLSTAVDAPNTPADVLNTPVKNLSTTVDNLSTTVEYLNTPVAATSSVLEERLEVSVKNKIEELGKRVNDEELMKSVIKEICNSEYFKSSEIAEILSRREDYIKRKFLSPMIESQELQYLHPEMINHPQQAYKTSTMA